MFRFAVMDIKWGTIAIGISLTIEIDVSSNQREVFMTFRLRITENYIFFFCQKLTVLD